MLSRSFVVYCVAGILAILSPAWGPPASGLVWYLMNNPNPIHVWPLALLGNVLVVICGFAISVGVWKRMKGYAKAGYITDGYDIVVPLVLLYWGVILSAVFGKIFYLPLAAGYGLAFILSFGLIWQMFTLGFKPRKPAPPTRPLR